MGRIRSWLVLMVAFAMASCVTESRPVDSRQPEATTRSLQSAPIAGPQLQSSRWLQRLNGYRGAGGLKPVRENPSLSLGDFKHSLYLVKNRLTRPESGLEVHSEDPGNLWYSAEGEAAAKTSNIISPVKRSIDPEDAVDLWMAGPFHAFPILDPELKEAGYGSYCEYGLCAAALNVGRGASWLRNVQRLSPNSASPLARAEPPNIDVVNVPREQLPEPVRVPPANAIISRGFFDGSEWPDPLAPCAGYAAPVGFPVITEFGAGFSPGIVGHSLSRNGRELEHCVYNADTYTNHDPLELKAARGELKLYAAIVLIPRAPLAPGGTYRVSITTDHGSYVWSFSVRSHSMHAAR